MITVRSEVFRVGLFQVSGSSFPKILSVHRNTRLVNFGCESVEDTS